MDVRKLRHAVTLARLQNFTRAAHELHITQSALSRSIQSLEAECRLRLFDRNRGAVTLTQVGREFMQRAEALLRNEADLKNIVEQAALGEGGRITIAATPLASRVLLTPILAKKVEQAHFHAEVVIGHTSQLVPMLMQESVDLCICAGAAAARNSPLVSQLMARLPLALIVRKDHPLAVSKHLRSEDIEHYPVIRSTPFSTSDVLPVVVSPVPDKLPAVTIEDFDALSHIASVSDAIWITSPQAVGRALTDGDLVAIPITWLPDTPYVEVTAYYLRRATLSPIVESMLKSMAALGARC